MLISYFTLNQKNMVVAICYTVVQESQTSYQGIESPYSGQF